ncbi:hypothetical protein B0H63DRAFT_156954 [Podospora didyma]|uniref:Uncharacterized protein n=1 Tax=Podospora didyma TaxID=330526 RepID=A0AAE0NTJ8_9PEZI|nr:hypothetical protein B0H63DRAFT_156954 [Podospora didyma]
MSVFLFFFSLQIRLGTEANKTVVFVITGRMELSNFMKDPEWCGVSNDLIPVPIDSFTMSVLPPRQTPKAEYQPADPLSSHQVIANFAKNYQRSPEILR